MWKWEAVGQPKGVIGIVHSAYEHHQKYAWLIEKFRQSGFHIIMGDLPGHGEISRASRAHEESVEEYEQYVEQLVEVITKENLPIFLYGHGLGATLCVHYLQKKSVDVAALILSSPWFHLKLNPTKFTSALTSMGKLTENMKSDHPVLLKETTRNYDIYVEEKDDPLRNTKITMKWFKDLQSLMKTTSLSNVNESVNAIQLLTAERDKITEIVYAKEWLAKQPVREFQYKMWKHCYHDLYLEPEREEIYHYIEDFLHNSLRNIGYVIE